MADQTDLAGDHHHTGVAGTRLAHLGDGGTGQHKSRVEVQRQSLSPLVECGVVRTFFEEDASATGQRIQPAQGLGRACRQGGAGHVVQQVLHQHHGIRQGSTHRLNLPVVLHHSGHAGAMAAEGAGRCQTDTRTGACHQRMAAGQFLCVRGHGSHVSKP